MRETLGQYLKREREARSVSLEELSKGTRINKVLLEALEKDDLASFSQKDFIIGFLRGYTRFLGLAPDEAIKRYLRQAELERHRVEFQQLSLFPNFSENLEEKEKGPRDSQGLSQKKKISKWIYIQGAIILVALGSSFYIQQILKEMDIAPGIVKKSIANSPGAKPEEKKRVIGDQSRRVYYLPGMKGYEEIEKKSPAVFNSEEEAIAAGYLKNNNND